MLSMCQSVQSIEDTKVNKADIFYRDYILIQEVDNKQTHNCMDTEQMNNSSNNLFLKVGKP